MRLLPITDSCFLKFYMGCKFFIGLGFGMKFSLGVLVFFFIFVLINKFIFCERSNPLCQNSFEYKRAIS